MSSNSTPNLEPKQREFLEKIDKIIPAMIQKLEEGYTMLAVTRLGRKCLPDGRIIELRLEMEVVAADSTYKGSAKDL